MKFKIFILTLVIIPLQLFSQDTENSVIATVFGVFDGVVSKLDLIEKGSIELISDSITNYKITSYTLTTVIKGFQEHVNIKSNAIENKAIELMKNVPEGHTIFFHDIKAKNLYDTTLLNPIIIKLGRSTYIDKSLVSNNKAMFSGIYNSKLDTLTAASISRLELLNNLNDTQIIGFEMMCNCRYSWDIPTSNNAEITPLMKNIIKITKANSFFYFYNILINEHGVEKSITPIFIELTD